MNLLLIEFNPSKGENLVELLMVAVEMCIANGLKVGV